MLLVLPVHEEILFKCGPFVVTFESSWCFGDCVLIHEPCIGFNGSLVTGALHRGWKIRKTILPKWLSAFLDYDAMAYCNHIYEAADLALKWCHAEQAKRLKHSQFVEQQIAQTKTHLKI